MDASARQCHRNYDFRYGCNKDANQCDGLEPVTRGVLISAPQAASLETIWSVRTTNAPEDLPWIHIRVRHCQQKDDRWLWGCAFTEELPWSVLLLFG